jgi:hypothetical protein
LNLTQKVDQKSRGRDPTGREYCRKAGRSNDWTRSLARLISTDYE